VDRTLRARLMMVSRLCSVAPGRGLVLADSGTNGPAGPTPVMLGLGFGELDLFCLWAGVEGSPKALRRNT
jgi:hypothetical protein